MEGQDKIVGLIPAKALFQEEGILKRIAEAIDRVFRGEGSITTTTRDGITEQVIDLPEMTTVITVQIMGEEIKKRVETVLKSHAVKAPYVTNVLKKPIEERGKGRIILPTEWDAPIKVVLFNPENRQLQIIVSSNNITAPRGWFKVNLPIDKAGKATRINIGQPLKSVLGDLKEQKRQEATSVDLLAHGTYFTIVISGNPDIDKAVLRQIRVWKT